MNRRLRLGTRRSTLAWAQSLSVADRLRAVHPQLEIELVPIETRGDRITHVKHDRGVPARRGYRSTAELSPHTDAYAILGLMCLDRAEKGGLSRATIALALHNEILASRSELLEPMLRGAPLRLLRRPWHGASG